MRWGVVAVSAAPDEYEVSCARLDHAGSRIRKRGPRTSRAGTVQRYECIPAGGQAHVFSRAAVSAGVEPPKDRVRCPDPRHADGKVYVKGKRETNAGTWDRYRCIRPDGDEHHFQVLRSARGTTLTSLERPPPCAEHPASHVTRSGSFGSGEGKRQRYYLPARRGRYPAHVHAAADS